MHYESLNQETKKVWDRCSFLRDDFYLAGGTALALQIGHRISVDLDFFSPEPIKKTLVAKIEEKFSSVSVLVNTKNELTLIAENVKMTFLHYAALNIVISEAKEKYKEGFNDRLFCEQLTSPEDLDDEAIVWLQKQQSKTDMQIFFQEKVKEFLA